MQTAATARESEQGFVLVGLIVAIFIILLLLGVAAPRVAKALRREREVEAVRRGNQYVRAVQLYYRKNGHYPGSMEQLEKSNNIRFLRQRYPDPLTGKPDWKLIHVGEAKTTVKGFFGKPLTGLSGAGGIGSGGIGSGGSVGPGTVGAGNSGSSFGSSSFGSSSLGTQGGAAASGSSSAGSPSASSTDGGATGPGSSSGSTGIGSQSATSFSGTGAPIMGVGSAATGDSIVIVNEQKTYPTWEFIYDPRIEQLKAKTSLLGGGVPSMGSGNSSGIGGSMPGMNGTAGPGGSNGFGSSGAGSSGGSSGFGSSSGSSSFGSGSSSPAPSAPVTTPQ